MKKITLSIVIALMLVLALGSAALAEQAKWTFNEENTYSPTPTGAVYDGGNPRNVGGFVNNFDKDGVTNYPYEIYLPNEQQPANYRIHTNYTNDTDACASCHATHTAVGPALLQWYSVYDTCIACHDGTVTTTYNVVDGTVGTTGFLTFGGMFGVSGDEFMSNHNVSGAVQIAAAPGGSTQKRTLNTDFENKQIIQWQTAFGCESCHSPHGQGGNARILHPDANGVATEKKADYYEYTVNSTSKKVYADRLFLVGYPYKVVVKAGATAASATAVNATYYSVDNSTGNTTIVFKSESETGYTVPNYVYLVGTPSLKVTMKITNYLGMNNGSPVEEVVEHKSGMNAFCGACHTDYNTEGFEATTGNRPGQVANGTFSKAMRHAVGVDYKKMFVSTPAGIGKGADKYMKTEGDNITCLTCHLAHGVTKRYWQRALTGTTPKFSVLGTWTDAKLNEIAGSSALKRMPNMATCEACHEKGAASEGYLALTGQILGAGYPDSAGFVEGMPAHYAYIRSVGGYQNATTCTQAQCHPTAAKDLMGSMHFTMGSNAPATKNFSGNPFVVQGMPFGMMNRFCGFPAGAAGISWAYTFTKNGQQSADKACGLCHVTLGTRSAPMFEQMGAGMTNEQYAAYVIPKIDCLICHATKKDAHGELVYTPYKRVKNAGGYFEYPSTFAGVYTLQEVAWSVAEPEDDNCMGCHEHGMQGNYYKRLAPMDAKNDVHVKEGVKCITCHPTEKHLTAKGQKATDLINNDRPSVKVDCVDSKCHVAQPHHTGYGATVVKAAYLNDHAKTIACEGCHVPTLPGTFADWSQIGKGTNWLGIDTAGTWPPDNYGYKGTGSKNDPNSYYIGERFEAKILNQWGNEGWRWFNGTGTAMANALSSLGFYDPYQFNNGYAKFLAPGEYNMAAAMGMSHPGVNPLNAGTTITPSAAKLRGDKIRPFRKFQAIMAVDSANPFFLLPYDLQVLKNFSGSATEATYYGLKAAFESPMLMMYYSAEMGDTMDAMAKQFGFKYVWDVNMSTNPPTPIYWEDVRTTATGFNRWQYGMNQQGPYWLGADMNDANGLDGIASFAEFMQGNPFGKKAAFGPMPLDATLMTSHSVKGPGMSDSDLHEYADLPAGVRSNEPRSCDTCHANPLTWSEWEADFMSGGMPWVGMNLGNAEVKAMYNGAPKPFDNAFYGFNAFYNLTFDPGTGMPNGANGLTVPQAWGLAQQGNPSALFGMMADPNFFDGSAQNWGANFSSPFNAPNFAKFDWAALGYSKAQLDAITAKYDAIPAQHK